MKNVYIYHHDDMDGLFSGALMYSSCVNIDNEIECIKVNYAKDLDISKIKKDDIVFFVDYSFSSERNLEKLIYLVDKVGCMVTWIDHHKTSRDLLDSGKLELIRHNKNFSYMINIKYCAAVLCYYYNKSALFIRHDEFKINEDFELPIKTYNKLVQYVDSWDTWKHNLPNTTEFKYGFDLSYHDIDSIGEILCLKPTTKNITSAVIIDQCINDGAAVVRYIRSLINISPFKININDNGKIYQCLVLNTLSRSSIVFGDIINDYDVVCAFSFNGTQYSYSLYTTKDNVDCSYLASKFGNIDGLGGGGHQKAAGFQTLTQILKKDETVYL